ncbi:SAM-dependent methyltransferase [Kibdelosporangium banguiense]|uniref:SAM-dependent methyltransferase n=1 Tax=Kibdelosporangium banguiense TaxID=1365924 RepID=A0ABS4TS82_9PSEU|nr:methyltransferase [Kibdelosporangium banguiense]MBP2327270.1 SAM-dependent methyltransferase [Kibdelosporangium banguiense]
MTSNLDSRDPATAAGILRLGNAFCESQVLLTAAELGVFSVLHENPATEQELRARLGLSGRGLRDFLRLLVEFGLLGESGGRYHNRPAAEKFLVRGKQDYLGGLLQGLRAAIYPAWGGLAETLRSGRPQSSGASFAAMLTDPAALDRYARQMDGVLGVVGPLLVDAVDWSACHEVLDVGGCRGGLMGRLIAARPRLSGNVFDLPELEPLFHAHMAEIGLTGKVRFHAGDFFRDPLPPADVLILGHVLHNWAGKDREMLVRKAFTAVNPGGVLLVHDRMLDDNLSRVDNLLASLMMVLMTDEGCEYPVAELTGIARAAGFSGIHHQPLGDNEMLVFCHKPPS